MQLTAVSLPFTLPVAAVGGMCSDPCTEGSRQLILYLVRRLALTRAGTIDAREFPDAFVRNERTRERLVRPLQATLRIAAQAPQFHSWTRGCQERQ